MTETSKEAVELLAARHEDQARSTRDVAAAFAEKGDDHGRALMAAVRQEYEDTAATLRALLAERDAARAALREVVDTLTSARGDLGREEAMAEVIDIARAALEPKR